MPLATSTRSAIRRTFFPRSASAGLVTALDAALTYFKPAVFSWFDFQVAPDASTGLPTVYNTDGTAFDVATLKPPAGVTYYVGYPGASGGNSGLSSVASLSTLSAALAKSDVGTIMLSTTAVAHTRTVGSFASTGKSVSIIGDGGIARIMVGDTQSWSLASGSTNTYQAAQTTVVNSVWDRTTLDANGDYTRLTKAASYAGTGDLPAGNWYHDGSKVYVRNSDSGAVSNTRNFPSLNAIGWKPSPSVILYMENVAIEGGSHAFQATNTVASRANSPIIYGKNCSFKYAGDLTTAGLNGISLLGCVSILQGCTAAVNAGDGFNYHINGITCLSVEIDCVGRDNGWIGTDICNGTTSHDGNSVVRVNGQYYRNHGPNLVDVDAGTTSWNVGCGAWGSTATTAAQQNANYQSQCSGVGGLWLDACWGFADPATATKYQLVTAAAGANLYFRSFSGALAFYSTATSVLRPY